ncbi:hypothetical protein SPBR_01024 [Sporothrix brasiliensis 5110]|uniref:AtuA-like ferredoxin-fold domain-containing protein n=1 Tax=Sporothrix brasiliensis 5110 TaxID=1398154 RepID=A0A0C2IVK1_9PEZI|nr:uncharacterized protein SPBR_01024 [Sporothrix brasiliensis 5110]KIH90815.1 hypothetical protein SPBR_01024 [Sporothrix brasiliensis 5110]
MKRAIRIVNCSGAIGDGGALHPQALAGHVIECGPMSTGGNFAGVATVVDVPARDAALCADKAAVQPDYGPTVTMPDYKGTVVCPFGDLASARSSDKGGNANIGVWMRDDAADPWLQAFSTSERAQALLGDDWRPEYAIERCEFPELRAVHILVRGLLRDGLSSSCIVDGFGKSVGELCGCVTWPYRLSWWRPKTHGGRRRILRWGGLML